MAFEKSRGAIAAEKDEAREMGNECLEIFESGDRQGARESERAAGKRGKGGEADEILALCVCQGDSSPSLAFFPPSRLSNRAFVANEFFLQLKRSSGKRELSSASCTWTRCPRNHVLAIVLMRELTCDLGHFLKFLA